MVVTKLVKQPLPVPEAIARVLMEARIKCVLVREGEQLTVTPHGWLDVRVAAA